MMRISSGGGDLSDSSLRRAIQLGVDCIDLGCPPLDQLTAVKKRIRSFGLDVNRISLPDMSAAFMRGEEGSEKELDSVERTLRAFGDAGLPAHLSALRGQQLQPPGHLLRVRAPRRLPRLRQERVADRPAPARAVGSGAAAGAHRLLAPLRPRRAARPLRARRLVGAVLPRLRAAGADRRGVPDAHRRASGRPAPGGHPVRNAGIPPGDRRLPQPQTSATCTAAARARRPAGCRWCWRRSTTTDGRAASS